jgi:two-component system chemotaxis response regulator CheB
MIRVLIAEDSSTTRALLLEVLSSDPEIVVIGQAGSGTEAVALTQKLRPDLVTMDVHMPEMDGVAATKEIMITAPTPIIIITNSSGVGSIEGALRAGALEVLLKPPGPASPGFEAAARKLIATVKTMSHVKVVRHWRSGPAGKPVTRAAGKQAPVVAIATSTGGPMALQTVLGGLPGDFPAPVLVVQHISAGFLSGLASWLNTVCDLHVKIAEAGERLQPHTVYLAPDDRHLGVTRLATVELSDAPPVGGFRPSGTFLFESAARAFGPAAIGVILTGMGEDGVAGLSLLRQQGGRILAQDEKSSVVFGMPGAAIAAGLADHVLPLDGVAARLAEMV